MVVIIVDFLSGTPVDARAHYRVAAVIGTGQRVLTLWRAAVRECGANVMRGDPLTFLEIRRHLRAHCSLPTLRKYHIRNLANCLLEFLGSLKNGSLSICIHF